LKPFSPEKETQRFCIHCKCWYHTRCLDALPSNDTIGSHLPSIKIHQGQFEDLFKSLISCPIQRGMASGVFGNGQVIHQARQWYDHDALPVDWTRYLDEMDPMWVIRTNRLMPSVTYYQCPTCPQYWL